MKIEDLDKVSRLKDRYELLGRIRPRITAANLHVRNVSAQADLSIPMEQAYAAIDLELAKLELQLQDLGVEV